MVRKRLIKPIPAASVVVWVILLVLQSTTLGAPTPMPRPPTKAAFGSTKVVSDPAETDASGTVASTTACGLLEQKLRQLESAEPTTILMQYRAALNEAKATNDKPCQARILTKTAGLYRKQEDYSQALQAYQEALGIFKELGQQAQQASCLNSIGGVLQLQGNPAGAIPFYQQALTLRRALGDPEKLAGILSNLGTAYLEQGHYAKALGFYQQALDQLHDLDKSNPRDLGAVLNNLGLVATELGEYRLAITYHEQALEQRRATQDRHGSAQSLHNLGYAYYLLQQPSKALDAYAQALRLRAQIDDRAGQAETLNNLGVVQSETAQSEQALASLAEALALFQAIGGRQGEGRVFDSLGTAHQARGDFPQALAAYQRALVIARETGDRNAQRITLGNIGSVLERQEEIALAILFYKQSVNVSEVMRKDLQTLPVAQRKSYAAAIAKNYRRLADLLLRQDRVLEAQRVLDLLKVQEAQDYLGGVRGTDDSAAGVPTFAPEQTILAGLEQLQQGAIAVGKELAGLRALTARTPDQMARVDASSLTKTVGSWFA